MTTKRRARPTNYKEREHPFCDAIRDKRQSLGLSYQALADKLGTSSRSYLRDIELGKYAVSVEIGMLICQLLEIDIELCFDFITIVEIDRIRENVKQQYQEWIEFTPPDVVEKMTSTPNAKFLHANLTQ